MLSLGRKIKIWRKIALKINSCPKLWNYLYLNLIINSFQRLCHAQPDLDMFVKVAVQIRDCTPKTLSAHCASRVRDFMQSLPSFVIFWMVTCTLHWCLDYRVYSDLPKCKSDTLKLSLVCRGRVGQVSSPWGSKWGLPWDLLYVTSGKTKLWLLVIFVIFMKNWRSKEAENALKSLLCMTMQATRVKF